MATELFLKLEGFAAPIAATKFLSKPVDTGALLQAMKGLSAAARDGRGATLRQVAP